MNGRRFANTVLLIAALIAASGTLFALRTGSAYQVRSLRGGLVEAAPLLLAVLLLASLRLPADYRITLAVTCLSLGIAAYVAEIYLREMPAWRMRSMARRLGVPYDPRTKIEVLRDLRRQGRDAWPSVAPELFVGKTQDAGFLPLGGISRVLTVCCNEVGSYLVYESDEHGFHNPPGLWSGAPLEIAALGDSYAQGRCVASDRNMVSLIRRRYPSTLNLGMSGNGPLMELADLREYLPELKPRRILWFYYEGNDLIDDLDRDRKDPFLMRYLEPGARQGLAARQGEVDAYLRDRVEKEYWKIEENFLARQARNWWDGFLRLRTLRSSLGLHLWKPEIDISHVDYGLFRRILAEAGRIASEWDGRITFVYLPASGRYLSPALRRSNDIVREKVTGIVRELDFPLIDITDVFARSGPVPDLYAPNGGHFTPRGYEIVAGTVLRKLDEGER